MSRHHHSSHHGRKNKQLEFLENYLGTIRKEVDEKTRELDALKLEGMHIENAKQFHKFEALTKKKQFKKEEKLRVRKRYVERISLIIHILCWQIGLLVRWK